MIPNTITSVQFPTNGATTQWGFPNKIQQATDLAITLIANQGSVSEIDYAFISIGNNQFSSTLGLTLTVSNIDVDSGCFVTFASPPAAGYTLDLRTVIPDTQPTSIKNQGPFLPDLHEEAFDRITRQLQDLRRLTYTFGLHGPDLETTPWPALPPAWQRANTGLVFDANGLPSLGVIPLVTFTQSLFNAYLAASNLALLQNQPTPAEIAAGVMPVNQIFLPGVIDRYGNNLIPGTTIMTSAFQSALAQQRQAGGAPMQLMPWGYAVDSNAVKIANDQIPLVIFGVPLQSYIVNKAPANTPTIQLIDKQTFDIRGIVFVGRAGFPNLGIDLTSASGGQRTGYGKLADIECFTNGVGLHMAGLNDVEVSNYAYWPGGESAAPGSPTFDTNAQIAGILADGVGIASYNPGQVNLVTLRKINVGEVNSIANGGCAIKIDGSISNASTAPGAAGPFQVWTLEDFDVGSSQRGLWMRNVTTSTFKSMYLTAEARFDQGCALIKIEELFGSTIVIDGTQSLGGCVSLQFLNCEAQTITADSNNSRTLHQNCFWFAAAGAGDQDSSLGKMVLNTRITSFSLADQIGNNGLCVGEGTDTPITLSNGSVITPVGGAYQRLTNSGAVTGISITAPNALSGVRGRMLVLANVGSGNITFAAYPGSNVADGTSCVITPLTQKTFFWDSVLGAYLHS